MQHFSLNTVVSVKAYYRLSRELKRKHTKAKEGCGGEREREKEKERRKKGDGEKKKKGKVYEG